MVGIKPIASEKWIKKILIISKNSALEKQVFRCNTFLDFFECTLAHVTQVDVAFSGDYGKRPAINN